MTHNSFARSDPFQSDETRAATEDDEIYHFISYAVVQGLLLELDGLQPGPINHGACTDDTFPDRVLDLIGDRISTDFKSGETRFNVLAVTKDPRIALREDPAAAFELETEEKKREQWAKENALRRHNFVNMAYLVVRAAVELAVSETGSIEALIEEGKQRAKRKREAVEIAKIMDQNLAQNEMIGGP
jgi:ubiquitin carboxyl-terminal hydrolase L5